MELLGLAFLGNYMNKGNNKDKQTTPISHKRAVRNENNIYDSSNVHRVRNISENMARDRMERSKNPEKTHIIPKYYNQIKKQKQQTVETFDSDSHFSDDECSSCSSNSPTDLVNKASRIVDNRMHERKFVEKHIDDDNYASQFDSLRFNNPSAPSSHNAVNEQIGSNSGVSRMELERNIAMNGGFSNFGETQDMSYGVVDKEHFTHDNMTPWFKGRTYGMNPLREAQNRTYHQRKMEMFTGSANDPSYRKKTESKPLFSPLMGLTNTFGMPSMTDHQESRYIPSMERRNELPVRQVKVSPGIGLGYNEVSKHGFHDSYRVLPRSVDELRTANKPKVSFKGVVIPGMKGQRGPVVSNPVKRRPLTFKEYGDDRMVKSLGYILAPTVHGEFDPKNMGTFNRGILRRTQFGPAKADTTVHTSENLREQYKQPTKQNFKQATPGNVILVEGLGRRPDHETFVPNLTQRGESNKYQGPLGNSTIQKGHSFDMVINIPDPNMRSVYNKYDRAGTAVTGENNKGHAYDFNDVPDNTKRDIHNQYDRAGNAIIGNMEKGKTYNPSDVPDMTLRDIHNQYDRTGNAISGNMAKGKTYNPSDVPDMTLRDIHNQYDRAGNAISGNMAKGKSYNPSDVPDMTLRDIYNQYDRAGNAINGNMAKGKSYNPNDVPDMTLRDIHNQYDRAGNAISGNMAKGKTYNPNDVPDMTKRDIHNQYDRQGNAISGNMLKGKAYDPNDVMDPTRRDIHNEYDRAGNAITGNMTKGKAYDPNDVPDMTKREMYNSDRSKGGAGYVDGQKGYTVNYVEMSPDVTKREMHNTDRPKGGAGSVNEKGYVINYLDMTPDITKREMMAKNNHVNPAKGDYEAQRSRRDAHNMQVNTNKERIEQRRAPTRSNYSKGPTMDYTMMRMCEPIQINRDVARDVIPTNDRLAFFNTREPILRTIQNQTMGSHVQINLQGNPYINNMIHKAI